MSRKTELFVDRMKLCMALKGVNQKDLADMSSIPYQTISSWARGVTIPRIDNIERLAQALDVNPGWLAYGDGDPK